MSKMFHSTMMGIRAAQTLKDVDGVRNTLVWLAAERQFDSEQEVIDLHAALNAKEKQIFARCGQ